MVNEKIVLEAPLIETDSSVFRARGGAVMFSGAKRIKASEMWYDAEHGKAQIDRASLTTCTEDPPHFRIEARSFTMDRSGYLVARGLSLWLGRVRVASIPIVNYRFSMGRGTSLNLPRPGYDKNDGLTLSQTFRVLNEDRNILTADLTLTSRDGLQGKVEAVQGLDGDVSNLPGRRISPEVLQYAETVSMREVVEDTDADSAIPYRNPSRLRIYETFTLRQRADDVGSGSIFFFKRPEIGATYRVRPFSPWGMNADPRLAISPEFFVSTGRFREKPSVYGLTTRTAGGFAIAANVFNLGAHTAFQPIIHRAWSKYGTGQSYIAATYGLDLSRIYANGTLAVIRYLKRNSDGATPFDSDDVDVRRELQMALAYRSGVDTFSGIFGYNLDSRRVFDWEISWQWRADCMKTRLSWNGRLHRFGATAFLLNL